MFLHVYCILPQNWIASTKGIAIYCYPSSVGTHFWKKNQTEVQNNMHIKIQIIALDQRQMPNALPEVNWSTFHHHCMKWMSPCVLFVQFVARFLYLPPYFVRLNGKWLPLANPFNLTFSSINTFVQHRPSLKACCKLFKEVQMDLIWCITLKLALINALQSLNADNLKPKHKHSYNFNFNMKYARYTFI